MMYIDTIQCEIGEGLRQPQWLTGPILDEFADTKANVFTWVAYTKELKKLVMGLFLDDLKRKLENFGNESGTTKKLNLYEAVSWRDTILVLKSNIFV